MANFQKYPVYQYDEPATYDRFNGGINIDPSSENIADNEMRDCKNMEYSHVTLRKRKGAKRICRLVCDETLNFIQGVFIFTENESFIIVASDGKLYYAPYFENVDLELIRLHIKDTVGISNNRTQSQFQNLKELEYVMPIDITNDGYVYSKTTIVDGKPDVSRELYFQNKDKIEFAAYNNKLFVATGTRFIEIRTDKNSTELVANCISPYIPNGTECSIYGFNQMSPRPMENFKSAEGAAAAIKNILFNTIYYGIDSTVNPPQDYYDIDCSGIMLFPNGKNEHSYFYKWEVFDANTAGTFGWRTLVSFRNSKEAYFKSDYSTSNCGNKIKITNRPKPVSPPDKVDRYYINAPNGFTANDNVKFRCTFSDKLKEPAVATDDLEIDKVDGSSFGEYTTNINIDNVNEVSTIWETIQTCKKIMSDGNKFILYDDAFNSGEWFKTMTDKPNYIVSRGCLNFKTTKNEQIIKAVHFKGVIVVFSHNKLVGGNIAVVTGNGDDDSSDAKSYSPYIRKVVNSEITCDCAKSIQIAENMLFFKFRDTVYAIEGSDISSEIITLYSMNDKLKMNNRTVDIPWKDDCVSEITKEYYALIWKEQLGYENGTIYIKRPAMRLKMYYKIGQEINGKIFFPWLRDESSVFNVDDVVYLNGTSTHIRDMELLQYDDEFYLDIDKHYDCSISLKAYDLNYPKISKYIRNMMFYYHRSQYGRIELNTKVKNEAGHILLDNTCSKVSLQDLATAKDGVLDGKIGTTVTDTKVYEPKYKFPLLQAVIDIDISCDTSFVFNSVTFNYYTTDAPNQNQFDMYTKINRRSTPLTKIAKINVDDNDIVADEDNLSTIDYNDTQYIKPEKKQYVVLRAGNPTDRRI